MDFKKRSRHIRLDGPITSWRSINNNVADRMIDGSLTHMFTERRRIRRRTQILNREFRQMHSVNSYKQFVKVKKAALRVAPENDDTDEDYFSNNDMDNTEKSAKSYDDSENDDDKICDELDINEMELCEIGIDDKKSEQYEIGSDDEKSEQCEDEIDDEKPEQFEDEVNDEKSEQCSNEVPEIESDTDDEVETVEASVPEVERSTFNEDIKRNFDQDFDELLDDNTQFSAPGDSGIDDDSVDSMSIKRTQIDCLEEEKQIVEESGEQMLETKKKPHLKITCTEIVTSKYRILRDNKSKSKMNEQSLKDSIVEQTNSPEKNKNSDTATCDEGEFGKKQSLTIPSEIDSLKFILNNLRIHNRYENDYYMDNYNHDKTNEYQSDDETSDDRLERPMNLDDLMEIDNLIELDTESTLTFKDLTEDDEIFLMEIPKSIIDNQDLRGRKMKIKKRSVMIEDTKFQTYRKGVEDLTCIMKNGNSDVSYEIGTIKPKASIVLRQKPPEVNPASLASNLADDVNQYAPFPKNLKRRNPLVLQSDSNNEYSKRKKDEIYDENESPESESDESM